MATTSDPAVYPGLAIFQGREGFFYNGEFVPTFAGGDGSDDTSSEGGSESDNSDGDDDSDNSSDDDDSKDDGKKFTQEEVNKILAKEKSKATRGKVNPKDYGFDSQKEFDQWVKDQKDKQDKNKSDDEKALQKAIDDATKEAESKIMSKANARLIKAEFKVAAREAGISKDALADAYVLAQTLEDWDVEVDEEKEEVVGLDDDFFKELKKQKPFLFADNNGGGSGDAGAGAGGGGGRGNKDGNVKELFPALNHVQ